MLQVGEHQYRQDRRRVDGEQLSVSDCGIRADHAKPDAVQLGHEVQEPVRLGAGDETLEPFVF